MDNREILFRAIAIHGNEWVFGNYIHSKRMSGRSCEYRIVDKDTGLESDIIPETLGQFTGLYDKNGKQVFENDITISDYGYSGTVELDDIVFAKYECTISDKIEVIGTIHDHLLKGE